MPEKITKLIPSTKETPKPEKPADVFSNEEFEEQRRRKTLPKTEESTTKSVAQIKGEIQQKFIEKIKELKRQFEKLEENSQ